jgi:hypothetical protein
MYHELTLKVGSPSFNLFSIMMLNDDSKLIRERERERERDKLIN